MRTKVQRRNLNWSKKNNHIQAVEAWGGGGWCMYAGGGVHSKHLLLPPQLVLKVQTRTSAFDRRYLEVHVYTSCYNVWSSEFLKPIKHFNHQDCFLSTHKIEFPGFWFFFFSLHSNGIPYLHFDTFQPSDNWVVWLVSCILPSLATLTNSFPLTFYFLYNQDRKKHRAAKTEHS